MKQKQKFRCQARDARKKASVAILHPHRATHHLASAHARSTGARSAGTRLHARPASIISRPHVLVGLKEDEINLRREQTRKHHGCTDAEAHAQTGRLDLVIVTRAEINCNRCEEHNAGRVHGKSNIFGFVEVFRDLSRLESVNRAEGDEKDDEDEGDHEAVAGTLAGQHRLQGRWINFPDIGWIVD